ncbi:ABC transporter permease [Propionivibrio sp.]|uniref:ABC transporter permease n=1 Tax=Propionivibrio sp. TaxID=2212460 RepID=UPI00345C58A5|nr:ABC transporter permease [Propionivibrio sp.]
MSAAGRSGSAIAARIGSTSAVFPQEIDALRVIGTVPVRYLRRRCWPPCCQTLPALTILSDPVARSVGRCIAPANRESADWHILRSSFRSALVVDDVIHGVLKSFIFAVIIAPHRRGQRLQRECRCRGRGRATTRAVLLGCIGIILSRIWYLHSLPAAKRLQH